MVQRELYHERYGEKAGKNNRTKIIVGSRHKITYQDNNTVKTERIIDVKERKRR